MSKNAMMNGTAVSMVVLQRIPSANQTVDGTIISALLLVTSMLLLCPQMFDLNKCKFF